LDPSTGDPGAAEEERRGSLVDETSVKERVGAVVGELRLANVRLAPDGSGLVDDCQQLSGGNLSGW
jgi:hypothetical protein